MAELVRASNLPTTLTNVMGGAVIGAASRGGGEQNALPQWPAVVAAAVAVACFYVAGMTLNDVADAAIDARERPERPIPSGRISRRAAVAFVIGAFAFGLGVLAPFGMPALAAGAALVALIIAYDLQHQRTAASALLMGLCRGMVYVVAAAAVAWPVDWQLLGLFAGAMTIYTTLVTLVSRIENRGQIDWRVWLAVAIPAVAVAPVLFVWPERTSAVWAVLALATMLGWLSRGAGFVFATPPQVRGAIMNWLAGMCLVDALYLTLLDQPLLAIVSVAAFIATALGHRRILGT